VNVAQLFLYLSLILVAGFAAMAIHAVRNRPRAAAAEVADIPKDRRNTWTMPPLALLERPAWSPGRKTGMLVLRGYLVIAVLLLVIKTVQLGH
jgi:hypothetical protein